MQRLLIGEVGSGKTVVALHALLRAFEHGLQGALMAPTETLAEQHLATLRTLLGAEAVPVALLTASTARRERRRLLAELSEGRPGIVVGTHALIEPDVRFAIARARGRGRAAPLRRAPAHATRRARRARRRAPHGARTCCT